jgi:type III restriction enzyme
LSDALSKLKGLSEYASKFGVYFRRIDALTKIGDEIKVLDLQNNSVRKEINTSTSATSLFNSSLSNKYL